MEQIANSLLAMYLALKAGKLSLEMNNDVLETFNLFVAFSTVLFSGCYGVHVPDDRVDFL
jgi:hypothetical protein